jgi:WhiB family transcriptional regulator, redox-sensing transcriptional regulator
LLSSSRTSGRVQRFARFFPFIAGVKRVMTVLPGRAVNASAGDLKGRGGAVHELLLISNTDIAEDQVELSWQERALCAQTDPEAFFPEKGGSTREAKKVCVGCDVRSECLEYALAHDERFGIWGGLSERERRKLKKRAV